MENRRKKKVKLRGSHTHGRGHKKKARGAGNRGGRGNAGLTKHKKFKLLKKMSGHLGTRGFTSPKQKGLKKYTKTINICTLIKLVDKGDIDVTSLGYEKVLGKGNITSAITVKSISFSEIAKKKIEKAGGKAIVLGETKEAAKPESSEKK